MGGYEVENVEVPLSLYWPYFSMFGWAHGCIVQEVLCTEWVCGAIGFYSAFTYAVACVGDVTKSKWKCTYLETRVRSVYIDSPIQMYLRVMQSSFESTSGRKTKPLVRPGLACESLSRTLG